MHKASHVKVNGSLSPLCVFSEAELPQNHYFVVIHSICEKCDTLGNNEYYIEKWQMLTLYGLVRNYCNSFVNDRYIRGSFWYFHPKNSVGMKEPRTSEVFLITPASLLKHKLCFFVLYVLNCFEEPFREL